MRDPDDRVTIDMDLVTRAALAQGMRRWYLEYDCLGTPYVWRGEAANESAADSLARHALGLEEPLFRSIDAQLVACLEAS